MYGSIPSRSGSMVFDCRNWLNNPIDTHDNAESRRKLKIKCGKSLFAFRTSIIKNLIDHVRDIISQKMFGTRLKGCLPRKIQQGCNFWRMSWKCYNM